MVVFLNSINWLLLSVRQEMNFCTLITHVLFLKWVNHSITCSKHGNLLQGINIIIRYSEVPERNKDVQGTTLGFLIHKYRLAIRSNKCQIDMGFNVTRTAKCFTSDCMFVTTAGKKSWRTALSSPHKSMAPYFEKNYASLNVPAAQDCQQDYKQAFLTF